MLLKLRNMNDWMNLCIFRQILLLCYSSNPCNNFKGSKKSVAKFLITTWCY
jgi:hypothetical protein